MNSDQIDSKYLTIDPDILKKAWDGDATAQLVLGKAYFNAVYVEDNTFNAFKWIHRSAEQGDIEAQFRLGDLYSLGQGVKQNYMDAYHWYTKSALQGYKRALIRIHNLYQNDIKMHCRGKLNSEEELRKKKETLLTVEYCHRELNEQRLEDNKKIVNYAMNYYSDQFRKYKSNDLEDMNAQLKIAFLYDYGYGIKKNRILAIDFYTKAAGQGHKDAQYNLGYLYEHNTDIKFNYKHALRWYREAATNDNIAAQNRLGYFYEKGLATEVSYEGALYWYTKSTNAGNSNSQLTLGKLYRKGQGVERNFSEAIKWYQLAANQGNQTAQNCLIKLLQNEEYADEHSIDALWEYNNQFSSSTLLCLKLQKDITSICHIPGIEQLKRTAQNALMSDGGAMFQIGLNYFNGVDFQEDKDTGIRWIKKSAKTGFQEAELKVAHIYEQGHIVEQDYYESSIWNSKIAKKKNNEAQFKLGFFYKNGLGVRKDPLEASKWFIKSAEQGNGDAQYQYGLLKYEGEGVRKDEEEAFRWFHRSALLKNSSSFYKMGYMYEVGDYPKRIKNKNKEMYKANIKRAIAMYKMAAKLDNKDAQFRLARIFEEGILISKDLFSALEYYTKAATSADSFYQTELAIRHINGAFGYSDYIKAFDLFKKAAEKADPRAVGLFQTPIRSNYDVKDHSKILDMLVLASESGVEGLEYIIGYVYEYGIYCGSTKTCNIVNKNAENWYSIAANKGDSRAKFRLGVMHEEGKIESRSFIKASRLYLQATEDGNSDAMYSLGLMYLYGDDYGAKFLDKHVRIPYHAVPKNVLTAFHLFTEASYKGNLQAREILEPSRSSDNIEMLETVGKLGYVAIQYKLGEFYEYEDDQNAFKWFTLAAEGGTIDAFYRLGLLYEQGRGTECNYSKAIECFEKTIKYGHDNAIFRLAKIYHYGSVIKRDYLKAYKLYKKAAEYGNDDAVKVLAITGNALGRNQAELFKSISNESPNSLSMLKFVAEHGDVYLQYTIGIYYEFDQENQKYEEAFKWYKLAADNNHSEAIYRLGLFYEKGLGVDQDYTKSFHLYQRVKDQGNCDVIYRLGIAFHHGYGVDKNPVKALSLYIKAANLGNTEAQYALGNLYDTGELVQKDTIKALVWYTKAYIDGNDGAIHDLYSLYDDKPYELYFQKKLFEILLKFEKSYKSDGDNYQDIYGSMYYQLGTMYLEGTVTEKNESRALKKFLTAYDDYLYPLAEPFVTLKYHGHDISSKNDYLKKLAVYFTIKHDITRERLYKLGMLYYNGLQIKVKSQGIKTRKTFQTIIQRDYSIASQYFKLAFKNGHLLSQKQIGIMYLKGEGTPKNTSVAINWLSLYAETLNPFECYYQGLEFSNTDSASDSFKICKIFLHEAAKRNYGPAKYQLASMYIKGDIVENENGLVMQWIRQYTQGMDMYQCYYQGIKFYEGKDASKNYKMALLYLRTAAEMNHGEAQAMLGVMYLHGYGVNQNPDEAMKWIQLSLQVMKGHECYDQGMTFYNGNEVDKNYKMALLYLTAAAKKKYGKAQAQLGAMCLYGYGIDQSPDEAIKWIQLSLQTLEGPECYDQGMKFYNGNEVDKNYEMSFVYLKAAAKKRYGKAQAQLGEMYLHGYGVDQNHEEATKWIQLSLEIMEEHECYDQGMRFYNGNGVDKNNKKAVLYLKVAAERKHGKAQAQLGAMYLHGYGVEQDHDEAMKWSRRSLKHLKKYECYDQGMKFYNGDKVGKNFEIAFFYLKAAAEKNYERAQVQLGEMYLHGYGVNQSHDEAVKWIQLSLKTMDKDECYDQGMEFYDGNAIDKNYKIALLYLKAAAERKQGEAQAQLGVMYLQGHGVEQSYGKAMEWIQLSLQTMEGYECYDQGMKFYNGNEVNQNCEIALLYLNAAAERIYGRAQAQLGVMYLHGYGVDQNHNEAIKWIQLSLKTMEGSKCFDQGMKFFNGNEIDKNYEMSLLYLKAAAKKRYGKAQAQLGILYLHGYGVEQSYDRAMEWIQRSLQFLTEYECYDQGMEFYNGNEVEKNHEIAFLYLKAAAERKHGEAQAQLGVMYLHGHGVDQSPGEAIKWIQRSLKIMEGPECYDQGVKFYEGKEFNKNTELALLYLIVAVEKKHEAAQSQIDLIYFESHVAEKSHNRVMEWIQKSRQDLNGVWCYNQGMNFYHGFRIPRNYKISLVYLRNGAKRNDVYSQAQLGYMYLKGIGVDQDHEQANHWYNIIKSTKNDQDFYKVGALYHANKIGLQDFSKSFELYSKALYYSNKSHALRGIGLLYEYGDGVSQDYQKALEYYTKSAKYYNRGAYYNLGLLRYYGRGVSQKYETAFNWFTEGASNYRSRSVPHVVVESNDCNFEETLEFTNRNYSLESEDVIYGKSHYYLGLMHKNGYGTARNEEKAKEHFEIAFENGIEHAKQLLQQANKKN